MSEDRFIPTQNADATPKKRGSAARATNPSKGSLYNLSLLKHVY